MDPDLVDPMTPTEYGDILAELGWSTLFLATKMLRKKSRTVCARWHTGEATIPRGIARWLRQRLALHRANPPPDVWAM